MAKILLLVPQTETCCSMIDALEQDHHECIIRHNPEKDPAAVLQERPDLAIMDTCFPWVDTVSLLNQLQSVQCPVIFLCHDRANTDHVKAIYHGMCEAVHFTCRVGSLRRCVRKLLNESHNKLVCGPLCLDMANGTATMGGEDLSLTTQEFSLLQTLMSAPNMAISREDLLRKAWGYLSIGETRTVDVHVQRLRRKIGPDCIETVYRTGYRLICA